MKKLQRGNAMVTVLVGFVGMVIIAAIIAVTSYIRANDYGSRIEAQLDGEYDNNMQVLAQGQQKVLEIAQVPAMYKDDFKEIISADVQGRYGKDGSNATFQWLKEHDVALDSSMYKKIQQAIESYRDEFKNAQTKMIDIRRQYEAEQGTVWRGFWLKRAGFPKKDMAKYKPIVTDAVQEIYKAGKESAPLKLR